MPDTADIPIAEILRGGRRESLHLGALVIADAKGGIIAAAGDTQTPVFARSAVKALQALPLLTSGAADRLGLGAPELALALASHAGEEMHAQTAAMMLARAGRDHLCLECGTHWPSSSTAARALAARGEAASALHNNCSGKHAGFICTAVARGIDPAGYVAADHPVMRDVTAALARCTGLDLSRQVPGVDGCSIPSFAIPLANLAAGFARFGTGEGLDSDHRAAALRLRQAAADAPLMLAGTGRFDSEIAAEFGTQAFVKLGAEGVYCGALPGHGLGFAIKCRDGALRAAEAATAQLLQTYLGAHPLLQRHAQQTLRNWRGSEVGSLRALPLH